MSRTLASLAAIALFASPALAGGYGFSADYSSDATPPIGGINITFNPEIIGEDNLTTRRSGPEFIHPDDVEDLIADLRDELEGDLSRSGAYAPMVAQPVATLNVEIVKVTSSNPALTENGFHRNLHFSSSGIGGAKIVADLVGPDGEVIGHFEYRWEESQYELAYQSSAWQGAERAFSRFARRLSSELDDRVTDANDAIN